MMLPASIEAHLKEVGFSQTELLILRHSLGGKPQSLRELAILTGKSTGVLDQAMKKLLQRNIFKKETINNSVRFVLTSLEAIVQWVEEDVQKKTKSLIRKKDDFASFVQTIDANGSRPKVEYFDGEEGIKKAYMQLLDMGCKELMQFLPLTQKEEDNPLSEFLSKFTRSRRKRGIALRVLTHDTPLGKRFQFKDAFNNRETVLLPLSQYPIPFEKILCGNCVACFKHSEKQAFFMHFPELAEGERGVFQNYWDGEIGEGEGKEIIEEKMHIWPLKIKTFALVCIGAALFATGITYSLYKQNYYLNTERVRDHVRSIAANAVKDFSWQDIRNINDWQDAMSNEYFNV
ncbi:MAG: hypothetical protein KAS32_24480, partial [Candidatus Peribacteraceae bacterium]|nr:hypothetical protein [Candidatus Peribacteraceae bacterium]